MVQVLQREIVKEVQEVQVEVVVLVLMMVEPWDLVVEVVEPLHKLVIHLIQLPDLQVD